MRQVELAGDGHHAIAQTTGSPQHHTRATVFGLDVRCDRPISCLEGARAAPTGRELELSLADGSAPAPSEWPLGSAEIELLCDQRGAGGVAFQIEAHPRAGYRIWGPTRGTHLLAPDGRRLTSFPCEAGGGINWQRLLIAQALPFAAVVRGLEVFHAGAVLLKGEAVAFTGPCGSGKSSTVAALCRDGADFLVDDAIALECVGAELVAHPGTPLLSFQREAGAGDERRPARARHDDSPQEVLALEERELMVRVPGATQAAPLRALFVLDRRGDGPSTPRFQPEHDPRTLLTATFNFVLSSDDRLRRLLDVCASLADRTVERVVFGPGADPALVAAAVRERLGAQT